MAAHDLQFPAPAFGIAAVHPEKNACKQSGFLTAGSGTDFDQHVFVVIRILGHEKLFEFFIKLFFFKSQGGDFFPRQFLDFRIAVFEHFHALFQIPGDFFITPENCYDLSQFGMFARVFPE